MITTPSLLGIFRNYNGDDDDDDGDGNVKKVISLISKTTTLPEHQAFFVNFFAIRRCRIVMSLLTGWPLEQVR